MGTSIYFALFELDNYAGTHSTLGVTGSKDSANAVNALWHASVYYPGDDLPPVSFQPQTGCC